MGMVNSPAYQYSRKLRLVSLVSYALPVLFFLKQYAYGFGNIYLTGAVLLCLLCMMVSRSVVIRMDSSRRALFFFTLFYVGRLALTGVAGTSVVNRAYFMTLLQYLASAFVIIYLIDYLDEDKAYKIWKILCIIVGIAVLYQSFQIYVLGHKVYPITVLPPKVSNVMTDVWHRANSRPVAFFTEPSCIAAFLMPVLFLAQKRNETALAVFLTIILLLCGSTTALVEIAFLWLVMIISRDIHKQLKILLIVLFLLLVFTVFALPVFNATVDKLLYEVSGESANFASRVTNGWKIFDAYNFPTKILGASNIDLSAYIRNHASLAMLASQTRTALGYNYFFNTAQRIGLTSGIVGMAAYAWMLVVFFRSLKKDMRPYFWIMVMELFYAWNFYTSNYFMIQMFTVLMVGGARRRYPEES